MVILTISRRLNPGFPPASQNWGSLLSETASEIYKSQDSTVQNSLGTMLLFGYGVIWLQRFDLTCCIYSMCATWSAASGAMHGKVLSTMAMETVGSQPGTASKQMLITFMFFDWALQIFSFVFLAQFQWALRAMVTFWTFTVWHILTLTF